MRRLRLFNFAAAVSLVLCLATVVLSVRSYWISDALAYLHGSGELGAQTTSGLVVIFATNVAHRTSSLRWDHWQMKESVLNAWGTKSNLNRVGFGYQFTSVPTFGPSGADPDVVYPAVVEVRRLIVPIWAIAVLLAIIPARWFLTALRLRRRINQNRCLTCGYDLRATPDRCPECGAVPGAVPPAAKGSAT